MRSVRRFRHTLVAALVVAAWGMGLVGSAAAAEPQTRPAKQQYNVLFIAVDDLKPLLHCYGAPDVRTPNLDALAARGTIFTRAYCQQAVCSPSRSSLMTGRRPDTTKVYDLNTHFRKAIPDVVTLPQHFKQHGYHTEAMSKIYHGGFNDPPSWSAPSWFPKGAQYGKKENVVELERERKAARQAGKTTVQANRTVRGLPWEDPEVEDGALPDGMTANHAIERLGAIAKQPDQPFFLAVGFLRPHLPFVAPKKYYDLYPPGSLKPADNPFPPMDCPPLALTNWGELRQYKGMPEKGKLTDEQAMELVRGYYAATSYCDAQIGRVLDELDRLELRQNTVVVLWGDHGWHLGDHGLWCKHTNFESATHAPLMVIAPGKPAGQKCGALVEFVDIYPTLCDLCGLEKPADLEGTSFVPLLSDPQKDWKQAAFSQYPRGSGVMGYSMRTDRYRYTEWQPKDRRAAPVAVELYDEQEDPEENVNLAGRDEQKSTVAELSKTLRAGWKAARPAK